MIEFAITAIVGFWERSRITDSGMNVMKMHITIGGTEQTIANALYSIRLPMMLANRMPSVMNSWKQEPSVPRLLAVDISLT